MDLDYLRSHWAAVRRGLNVTVSKLHGADLEASPFPSAWTVRELLLHIAQEEIGERDYGIRQTLAAFPDSFDPSHYPDLASVQALLETSHQGTLDLLASLAPGDLSKVIVTP
jgi:hypothetical protein